MKALCYGSLNPDLVHHVERLPVAGDDLLSDRWHIEFGGGGGNAAVALATWSVDTVLVANARFENSGVAIATAPEARTVRREKTMAPPDICCRR